MSEPQAILNLLTSRKIKATITTTATGPRLTCYTLAIPDDVPVNRVTRLQADLSALFGLPVRVMIPLGGEPGIAVEVPKAACKPVPLDALLPLANEPLKLALGRDIRGDPVVRDLRAGPHLLVAGATGAGKSVALNAVLLSLLRHGSEDVRLAMIDLKRVELTAYANMPHLVRPVATTRHGALQLLTLIAKRVEARYKLLEKHGLRQWSELRAVMPGRAYLVLVVDELGDLLADQPNTLALFIRIAQLGRAAGVHIVAATQRPDSRIISGVLKAQFPIRLAFAMASATDSRVILDTKGAESLLGKGDGLLKETASQPLRLQGAMYSQNDIDAALTRFKGIGQSYWSLDSLKPCCAAPCVSYALPTPTPLPPLPHYATPRGRAQFLWGIYGVMFFILAGGIVSCFNQCYGGTR